MSYYHVNILIMEEELRSWTESYITQKHYGALFGETPALKSIVKFSVDPNAE